MVYCTKEDEVQGAQEPNLAGKRQADESSKGGRVKVTRRGERQTDGEMHPSSSRFDRFDRQCSSLLYSVTPRFQLAWLTRHASFLVQFNL